MDATLVTLLSIGVPSAVISLGVWRIQRSITKSEKKRDEREEARAKHESLMIQCIGASIQLGEVTAKALRDGRSNGEVTAALENTGHVMEGHTAFMREQGIQNFF